MKQTQFLGWIKRAYPDINIQKQDNGDFWLSNNNYLQVIARTDNIVEFRKLRNSELPKPLLCSRDEDIVTNIRNLWGDPSVAFSLPQQHKTEVERKEEESKSEPKKEQPKKPAQETKVIDREEIIDRLKAEFPDLLEVSKVPGGKAVKINGSKLTLYDYGISSKPSVFIPWARREEVEELVTNFISINK